MVSVETRLHEESGSGTQTGKARPSHLPHPPGEGALLPVGERAPSDAIDTQTLHPCYTWRPGP
jgi:hypothetical protein